MRGGVEEGAENEREDLRECESDEKETEQEVM